MAARRTGRTNIFMFLLVFCNCVLFKAADSFQACPPVDPDTTGICSQECSSDSDCNEGTLCCSNGCGHTCVLPFSVSTPPDSLLCPSLNDSVAGLCSEECGDGDCANGQLCCSNGCGHTCQQGISRTPTCASIRDMVINSSLIGAHMPQCDEEGNYLPVQCHASTGYCWCASIGTGEAISDLTNQERPQCNCSYNNHVYLVGETFDLEDEGNCGTCSCTVDGGVKCIHEDCGGDSDGDGDGGDGDDSDGVFYSCPAVREGSSTPCTSECQSDSDCSSSLRCCYNGCGYSCSTLHLIPYIDISSAFTSHLNLCPDPSDLTCDSHVTHCEDDGLSSCEEEEGNLCCPSSCGSPVCVSTSSTPCFTALVAASNSSGGRLGSYRPRCSSDGKFRNVQCQEHFCWCVDSMTGKPLSDIVLFEQSYNLQCTSCVYNGLTYRHLVSFPSGDGCNTCSCIGGTISCSTVDCSAVVGGDEEDGYDARNEEALWEWWHSVLVSCVVVVVVLVAIVMALLLGIVILMKQTTANRHHRLKEATVEHECEMVEFRNKDSVVPIKA